MGGTAEIGYDVCDEEVIIMKRAKSCAFRRFGMAGRFLALAGSVALIAGLGGTAWGQNTAPSTTTATTMPSAATDFEDTDGIHKSAIDTLNEAGVLSGTDCAPKQFCPDDEMPRWVMAVWLVRAIADDDPVPVTASQFVDVEPSAWWTPYVEALADLGITKGCGTSPTRYCPHNTVTRAQMATFLVRAFQLDTALPFGFVDTVDNIHEASIDSLAASGITSGCGTNPTRYCPHNTVTRAQMATFLARATDLIATPEPKSVAFTGVSVGWEHSCGLFTDYTIACWGANESGQADAPEGYFSAVDGGRWHSCAIRTDGTIACWGNNDSGQTDAPEGYFTSVTAGSSHSCGVRTDGTVTCWGNNDSGQTDAPEGYFTSVTAGASHTCGLRTTITGSGVTCWGQRGWGRSSPPSGGFTAIHVNHDHSCGVRVDGTIACWGKPDFGQNRAPTGQFTAVASGGNHACGLKVDRSVTCWGWNNYDQRRAPSGRFISISAGYSHSCGIHDDGTISCWGRNHLGQSSY